MNKLHGVIHNICIWKTIQYVCIQKYFFTKRKWETVYRGLVHNQQIIQTLLIGRMQKQKHLKVQKKILIDKKCWKAKATRHFLYDH